MILIDLVFPDQLKPTTQRNEDCNGYLIEIKLYLRCNVGGGQFELIKFRKGYADLLRRSCHPADLQM